MVSQREERATYDNLNRLTVTDTYAVGNSTALRSLATSYNLFGNITTKTSSVSSDTKVTGYQYGTHINSNQAGPHAVRAAVINGINNTFSYDASGNITTYAAASGDSKFIEWNVRNLPVRITKGTSAAQVNPSARDEFYYGPDGEHFYRKSSWMDGSTARVEHTFYLGSFEERVAANDPTYASMQKTRIGGNIAHIKAVTHLNTSESRIEYALTDHLGSVEAVVDQQGNKLFTLAYDPFGERKKPNGASNYTASELNTLLTNLNVRTSRGFTGHEHLDRTGLIHMNGRIYDPQLGRFLSPDPIVQAPTFSQSHNRYSYVFNNPLVFTDPSGFSAEGQEASGVPETEMSGDVEEMTVTGVRHNYGSREELMNLIHGVALDTTRPEMGPLGFEMGNSGGALNNLAVPDEDTPPIDPEKKRARKVTLSYLDLVASGGAGSAPSFIPGAPHYAQGTWNLTLDQRKEGAKLIGYAAGFVIIPELIAARLLAWACSAYRASVSVWRLSPTARGSAIEAQLARTDYKDWFNIGQLNNGKFPLVDFQKGNTVVSLKSVNTTGSSWVGRMERHIEDLGTRGANINGNPANMVLDLRVQPGGGRAATRLVDYGRQFGVNVIIKEF